MAHSPGRPVSRFARTTALDGLVREGDGVLVLGLQEVGDAAWEVLAAAGLEVIRTADTAEAVGAIAGGAAQIVVTDAELGPGLVDIVRARPELADAHVVVCADLTAPEELRRAIDSGADDVMRVPFDPHVLAMRVATGLQAARLRASEAMLRSLVDSIPGAIYRCACDGDWTMELLSDEIENIVGYPASDFIDSAVRTFASVEHPEDHDYVEHEVMESVRTGKPFALEYRLVHRDGSVRWVLERGLRPAGPARPALGPQRDADDRQPAGPRHPPARLLALPAVNRAASPGRRGACIDSSSPSSPRWPWPSRPRRPRRRPGSRSRSPGRS